MSLPLKNPLKGEASEISDKAFVEDAAVRYFMNVPDEDISTPARLMFVLEEAFWFYFDYMCAFSETKNYGFNFKKFLTLVVQYCPQITYLAKANSQLNNKNAKNTAWSEKDISDALTQFREYKSTIPVRGCCILNSKLDSILLVQDATSKTWSFPRGKIGKDEDDVKCAIRECYEETGLDMAKHIRADKYMNTNMQNKQIRIYFCTDVPMNVVEKFKPMSTYEISDMKWFSVKSLKKLHGTKSKRHTYLVIALIFKISKFINEESIERKFVKAEQDLKRILKITTSIDPKEVTGKYKGSENAGASILNMIKKKSSSNDTAKSSPVDHSSAKPISNPGTSVLNLLKKGSSNSISTNINNESKNESGKSLLSLLQKKKTPELKKDEILLNTSNENTPETSNANSLLNLLQQNNNIKKQSQTNVTTPTNHFATGYNITPQQSINNIGSPMMQFQQLMNQQGQHSLPQNQQIPQQLPLQIEQAISQQLSQHMQQQYPQQIMQQMPQQMPLKIPQQQQQQQMYIPNVNIPNYQMAIMQQSGFPGQAMNQQMMPQQQQQQKIPNMMISPFQQATNMSPSQYALQQQQLQQPQQQHQHQHQHQQMQQPQVNASFTENPRKALLSLLNSAQRNNDPPREEKPQSKNVLLNDLHQNRPQVNEVKKNVAENDKNEITSNSDLFKILNKKKNNVYSNPHIGKSGSLEAEENFEDFEDDVEASLPDESMMM